MKVQLQFVLKLVLGMVVFASIESCAPPGVKNKSGQDIDISNGLELVKPTLPAEPIDYELVPTQQVEVLQKSTNVKYEKPLTEIKTQQTVLHLNQVKMSKVALTYDMQNHSLAIKGLAEVMDDTGRLLADSSFSILGQTKNNDLVITLKSAADEKVNSSLKPVVRAMATCLATTMNDEPDCSRVIIDFFIAYKQKVYTEQMEIKPSLTKVKPAPVVVTPPVPVVTTDPAAPAPAPAPAETSELQKEDSEESSPGRFEGQAEAVDLTKVFDQDDDIQQVLKPKETIKTPAPEKKVAEPVKVADKKDPKANLPTPPKSEAKPAVNTPTPEALKAVEKEKTITNDISETKSGELRPKNQAVGYPNDGSLHNATSLLVTQKKLDKKSFFEIVFPERQRYFATYEMAEMLTRLGERLHLQFNKNLAVSDISKLKGGLLSPHLSHQIGMDADIAYPSTSDQIKFPVVVDMHTRRFNPNLFSVAKTFDLLKFAFQQEDLKIDRVFIDRSIKASLCEYAKGKGELTGPDKNLVQKLFKSIEHINGHGDHFHIRLSCTPAHPGCRKKNYLEVAGCM